jgi:MFS family permease
MAICKYLVKVLEELGLLSVWRSPLDTKLLFMQRFVRLFAYGSTTLFLVSYLVALGISQDRVGVFMMLTLVGDMIISFCLTLFADGLGRRMILASGAALMSGSGIVFALSGNYWVLLAASIFGVISPRFAESQRGHTLAVADKLHVVGMKLDPFEQLRSQPWHIYQRPKSAAISMPGIHLLALLAQHLVCSLVAGFYDPSNLWRDGTMCRHTRRCS